MVPCAPGLVGVGGCRTRGRKPLDGFRSQLRRGVLRLFGGSAFWSSLLTFAGFFKQLDISHGSPRDERTPGVFFFGVFFDGFYGDSTGVVADQPSVEAAPSGEPHGYSLSIPLLRQVPDQHASPVCLHSPGILPLLERVPPVLGPSTAVKLVTSWAPVAGARERAPIGDGGARSAQPPKTNYRFLGIDELVFGSSACANFREA